MSELCNTILSKDKLYKEAEIEIDKICNDPEKSTLKILNLMKLSQICEKLHNERLALLRKAPFLTIVEYFSKKLFYAIFRI